MNNAAERFRAAVEAMDHAAAVETLAEDVVFHSPATFKPFEGRDATAFVLAGVMRASTPSSSGRTSVIARSRGSTSCASTTTI
jgi:ketosteroid isomerase-like protein